MTGVRTELLDQLRALRKAGFRHIGITIRHGHPEMREEWAEVFAAVYRLRGGTVSSRAG